jgi:hypothetical protein
MKYKRDDKYSKSNSLVDYLLNDKELPRSMRDLSQDDMLDLLLYNIIKKEEHIKIQRERMKEYQDVFDGISRFTNSRKIVYQ